MKGHWSHVCRTLKHLVNLYQTSKNEKGKEIGTSLFDHESPINIT